MTNAVAYGNEITINEVTSGQSYIVDYSGSAGSSTFALTSTIAATSESVRASTGTITLCGYNNIDSAILTSDANVYYHAQETSIEWTI